MLDTYQHLQLGFEPDVSDFHLEMVNKFQTHMEKTLKETKSVLTQAKDNEENGSDKPDQWQWYIQLQLG